MQNLQALLESSWVSYPQKQNAILLLNGYS